jgi:predicted XRE-type DNA-binding protein
MPRVQPSKIARKKLAKDRLPRLPLAQATCQLIERRGLSRQAASLVVKDAASQVSRLMTGHFHEFSADRMVGFLLDLGANVHIAVSLPPARKLNGRVPKGRVTARVD